MKKNLMVISLVLVLVLSFSSFAMAASTVKLGCDFGGQIKGTIPGDEGEERDTDSGLTVGYEYTFEQEQLEYGFGLQYQFERSVKDSDGKFNFIPVYGLLNYNFTKGGEAQPYITARVGYNFLSVNDAFKNGHDTKGGIYYGAGIGITIHKNFKVEALYSENKGSLDGGNDISNRQISLNIGYKF